MLKKNSLLGRLVPYIAVVVLCFALFFCLSKAYDGDEASYVTVQNGETEVYNGVSINVHQIKIISFFNWFSFVSLS